MDKPTAYIETTIAGHLTSRLPTDATVAAQMLATRDWWAVNRTAFDCFTSQAVLDEAGRGDPVAAAERLLALEPIPLVRGTAIAESLANQLLARGAFPLKERFDALHVAIAATNGIMFLLTWDRRHLANAAMRAKIEQVCRDCGFEPPIICTPLELQEQLP